MQTRVVVQDEIRGAKATSGWCLAFQKVRYVFEDGEVEDGYRFIWYRPDGSLQAARGQARIETIVQAAWFVDQAKQRGWK